MSSGATAPGSTPRRFPWLRYWITLAVIVLIAFLPAIPLTIAAMIAGTSGCRIDEGSIHACVVGASDLGPALYTMGVMGWFFLATFPLAILLALVWLVVFVIHRNRWETAKGRAR